MRSALRPLVLLLLAVALGGCQGDLSEPENWIPSGTPEPLYFTTEDSVTATAVKRNSPLASPVSAQATIGPEGGTISLPGTGFFITFRARSVSAPTLITVTALAGSCVAYTFEPDGLVFRKAPMVNQQLNGTNAFRNLGLASQLEGTYVENLDAGDFDANCTAVIHEARPGLVDDRAKKLRFQVEHFSGYLASHGRSGGGS